MPVMRHLTVGNVTYDTVGEASVTQVQTSGTKIATVNIDGASTDIYAPSGGGGGGSAWVDIASVFTSSSTAWDGDVVSDLTAYANDSFVCLSGLLTGDTTQAIVPAAYAVPGDTGIYFAQVGSAMEAYQATPYIEVNDGTTYLNNPDGYSNYFSVTYPRASS